MPGRPHHNDIESSQTMSERDLDDAINRRMAEMDDAGGARGDVADAPDHMPRSMSSRCAMCGVDMSVRDLKDDPKGMRCSSCARKMAMHPARPGSPKGVDADGIEADDIDTEGLEMWNVPGTNAGGGLKPASPPTQPSVVMDANGYSMDKDAKGHGSFKRSGPGGTYSVHSGTAVDVEHGHSGVHEVLKHGAQSNTVVSTHATRGEAEATASRLAGSRSNNPGADRMERLAKQSTSAGRSAQWTRNAALSRAKQAK